MSDAAQLVKLLLTPSLSEASFTLTNSRPESKGLSGSHINHLRCDRWIMSLDKDINQHVCWLTCDMTIGPARITTAQAAEEQRPTASTTSRTEPCVPVCFCPNQDYQHSEH